MRIYLAGPDVFCPDPLARAATLKAICARHGLTGISPLDPIVDMPAAWLALPLARRIALCNETHIRAADAVVANLTPFRGPSADVGTVFEIGFMRALDRPVFGWTNAGATFLARTLGFVGAATPAEDGGWRDGEGMLLEAFDLHDNLMIDGAILASGGQIFAADIPYAERWTDLSMFERCITAAAHHANG